MTAKITPDMTVLSETLLIPLWAKAVEQERDERLLTDPEAPRMLAQIDYDFSKFKNIVMSQVGCCGRAQIFDNEAQKFIAAHPDAVVVQLGAGLDTRFERLGRPQITAWYDLDLPEVIALRRQLLPESTNHYLAISLFDESWMQTVAAHGKPVLLLSANTEQVRQQPEAGMLFAALLEKPLDATALAQAIRRHAGPPPSSPNKEDTLSIANGLWLDTPTRRLHIDGRVETLSPAETRLLVCLAAAIGKPCDRTVDVLVSRLRRRLRGSVARIVTVHGLGYTLTVG